MTILRERLPKERGQPTASLRMKCDKWLRSMEEQKILAREMIRTARTMCDRAAQMSRPSHLVLP